MTIRNWSSSVCSTVLTLCRRDLLEERGRAEAALDVVTATRRYWEDDASVRVDDLARQQIDREGLWLRGWLRARTGVTAFDRIAPVQLASAIAALPPLSRQVFLLHAPEDLDYGRISARLAMPTDAVDRKSVGVGRTSAGRGVLGCGRM